MSQTSKPSSAESGAGVQSLVTFNVDTASDSVSNDGNLSDDTREPENSECPVNDEFQEDHRYPGDNEFVRRQKMQRLLGSVLPAAEGAEFVQALFDQLKARGSQTADSSSASDSWASHKVVVDMQRKDTRANIISKYKATSTKISAGAAYDLECTNGDLLEVLSKLLGGDCFNQQIPCDNFIRNGVFLSAPDLINIVTLARANQCVINELRAFLQMGIHQEGGWEVVKALQTNTGEISGRFLDEEEQMERLREGRKRARLMAPAKKSGPTPRRNTSRRRSASRGRAPSRRRSPSPQSSRPVGHCWTCGSTKHQKGDCPSKGNTSTSNAHKGKNPPKKR